MKYKLPTFTRLPSYSVFHYQPRYYDPKKDEKQTKTKKITFERSSTLQQSNSNLSKSFNRSRYFDRGVQKQQKGQNMRLLVLIVLLSMTALFFLEMISGTALILALLLGTIIYIQKSRNL